MKNQFILNPSDDVVLDADQIYSIEHGIIHIGVEDVQMVIEGAKNVIMLEGRAKGSTRLADAIEDAVLHTCSVAKDYDLFSADKIIIRISTNKPRPLLVSELSDIPQFAEMFNPNVSFTWGVSECNGSDDTVVVRIIASNITHK